MNMCRYIYFHIIIYIIGLIYTIYVITIGNPGMKTPNHGTLNFTVAVDTQNALWKNRLTLLNDTLKTGTLVLKNSSGVFLNTTTTIVSPKNEKNDTIDPAELEKVESIEKKTNELADSFYNHVDNAISDEVDYFGFENSKMDDIEKIAAEKTKRLEGAWRKIIVSSYHNKAN